MNLEYGNHLSHPRWKELCIICDKIDYLKTKARDLRDLIDKEIFDKALLYSNKNEGKE